MPAVAATIAQYIYIGTSFRQLRDRDGGTWSPTCSQSLIFIGTVSHHWRQCQKNLNIKFKISYNEVQLRLIYHTNLVNG